MSQSACATAARPRQPPVRQPQRTHRVHINAFATEITPYMTNQKLLETGSSYGIHHAKKDIKCSHYALY